jgi:hypothetical protein
MKTTQRYRWSPLTAAIAQAIARAPAYRIDGAAVAHRGRYA